MEIKGFTLVLVFAICVSCNQTNKTNQTKNEVEQVGKLNQDSILKSVELKGDFCFLKAENKDTTIVKVRILSDDDIRGEMIWQPWQKDGAVGSLTGKLNSANELELLYNYIIEGNRQTEVKIMKIENNALFIKRGELLDKNNDGNLSYKDVLKAQFSERLDKVDCE